MTHAPIIAYLENLNAKLVDFAENSFFRMDLAEITGAFRKGITFPAMCVESPEGDAENSTKNNSVLNRTCAFTIYKKPQQGNFIDQDEKIDDCEKIGLKIIARMRLDNAAPDSPLYNKFEVASVRWVKVGPIFNEGLYGYRFIFTIAGDEKLIVNPDDWSDIENVCS
ncbi:hypothetical protein [Aequorivita echinoideorum]|uniref:Uncharacterized protein n=1 Tax=Aequorivita echinoideorum TaxID=1549647 RepID=A0ABS5S374_9FLAO|nr:hypothetical protein [Aequorivita echinoideorum]MBT0607652.1 hypothetical protein [Aequorivita echinoideorum]